MTSKTNRRDPVLGTPEVPTREPKFTQEVFGSPKPQIINPTLTQRSMDGRDIKGVTRKEIEGPI